MSMSTTEKALAFLPAVGALIVAGIAFGTLQAESQAIKENVAILQAKVDKQEQLNRKLVRELGVLNERSKTSITQGQVIQEQIFEVRKLLVEIKK